MRALVAATAAALLSIAQAITLPHEATMFVADDDGVIVGVGHARSGERFALDVIASYQGFARLVIVASGGEVVVHDVVVTGGIVLLDLVDLRAIALRSGFVDVAVDAIDVVDTARALLPASPSGSAPDAAAGAADPGWADRSWRPIDVGGDDRTPSGGPAAGPPPGAPLPAPPVGGPAGPPTGTPAAPSTPPVAPPAAPPSAPPVSLPVTPGPPASTPGVPDGPPAHGPGGAQGGGPGGGQGGGPQGQDVPTPDADAADEADDEPGPPGQRDRP